MNLALTAELGPPPTSTHISESKGPVSGLSMGLGPDLVGRKSSTVRLCSQTTCPGCDCCQPAKPVSLLTQGLSYQEHSVDMGLLGNALPDVLPPIVAGCYCIDKPIPSDFLSLSDKGQKSNEQVADLLAWDERQAGDALKIREGRELRFHPPPTLFPALKLGGLAATGCDYLATLENRMREARES